VLACSKTYVITITHVTTLVQAIAQQLAKEEREEEEK